MYNIIQYDFRMNNTSSTTRTGIYLRCGSGCWVMMTETDRPPSTNPAVCAIDEHPVGVDRVSKYVYSSLIAINYEKIKPSRRSCNKASLVIVILRHGHLPRFKTTDKLSSFQLTDSTAYLGDLQALRALRMFSRRSNMLLIDHRGTTSMFTTMLVMKDSVNVDASAGNIPPGGA